MRKFILKYHKLCYVADSQHHYKENNKFLWVLCRSSIRLCKLLMCIYLYLYSKMGFYPKPLCGRNDLIVSLTTFPKRIKNVWQVVDSVIKQTIQPSKIYLYLSCEEFPNGRDSLPKRLLGYEKLGLEICFREKNLMPHKKYIYALQEHKDKCIITVDDDHYYDNEMIEKLLDLHHNNPDCVCSNAIHYIKFDEEGSFLPYLMWEEPFSVNNNKMRNLAVGYGGVLYPPNIFKSKEVFNVENILKLALRADDLWLKVHELLQGTPVATNEFYMGSIGILGTQSVALMKNNCSGGMNDEQWKRLCDFYGINSNSFTPLLSITKQ